MISSHLFRPDDCVHYRFDMQPDARYHMLHEQLLDCWIGLGATRWIREHSGKAVTIDGRSSQNRYIADEYDCLVDTIFTEGRRVGRFLLIETVL